MSPRSARTRLDPGHDALLVERCLSGEARAWEALVRRHERLVYAVARNYRLSDADAADVFQEVFAALYRGLPRLRDARSLVRWLSSTTERIARALEYRRRRELALSSHEQADVERIADEAPEIGADLDRLEEQAMVRLALESLHERCRTLLLALYYEDPPPAYAALARRLGMPLGSLGPTRARCIERLRQALEGRFPQVGISPPRGRTSGDDGPTEASTPGVPSQAEEESS